MSEDAGTGFIYHELWTSDAPGRIGFYRDVFGWSIESVAEKDGEAWRIEWQGVDLARIVPLDAEEEEPDRWNCFLSTPDLGGFASRVENAGGQILVQEQDLEGLGRASLVSDPMQGIFAAVELSVEGRRRWAGRTDVIRAAAQPAPESESSPDAAAPAMLTDGPAATGFFCWHDLLTCDLEGSAAFYRSALGMDSRSHSPETAEVHRLLSSGGVDIAGLMASQDTEHPAHWLPYVAVNNVAATVEAATAHGGEVWLEPVEVERLGTFAVIADLGRALIALRQIEA